MPKVVITGWKTGLNKVELSKLLRQHAGLQLGEAKAVVERLLEGEVVAVECPDAESTLELYRAASSVGAVCSLDPVVAPTGAASMS
jgi:ribosomal protein L7/L12